MKTKQILTAILLLALNQLFTQNWEILYGGPNQSEKGKDVIETYDKGYLLVASKESKTIQAIKTDINGEILWQKSYNNNDKTMYMHKVIETSDHGYIMVGYSKFYNNNGDPIIIKFNTCFEKEWCRILHNPQRSGHARDVIENDDNLLIVLTNYNNDNPDDDMMLYGIKLDGELVWENDYATQEDYPLLDHLTLYDIEQIGGEYFASGRGFYAYPDNPNVFYQRPFIVGIDENFDEKWILPFGMNDSIYGKVWRMNYQHEDTIYAYGYQGYFDGDETLYRGILIKFNALGEELGYFELENDSVSDFNDGNILNLKFLGNGLLLGTDMFIDGYNEYFSEIIFDTLSNVYNIRMHENYRMIQRMITTYNNKYLQAASYRYENGDYDALLYKFNEDLELDSMYTATFTYDSLCPSPIQSEDIVLDDCFITGIGELPSPKQYYSYIETIPINIYPNPASNIVHFTMENTEHHSNIVLQVFDIYGKLIEEQNIYTGQKEAFMDVSFWESGMYAVVVTSTSSAKASMCVAGKNKFIVR